MIDDFEHIKEGCSANTIKICDLLMKSFLALYNIIAYLHSKSKMHSSLYNSPIGMIRSDEFISNNIITSIFRHMLL